MALCLVNYVANMGFARVDVVYVVLGPGFVVRMPSSLLHTWRYLSTSVVVYVV